MKPNGSVQSGPEGHRTAVTSLPGVTISLVASMSTPIGGDGTNTNVVRDSELSALSGVSHRPGGGSMGSGTIRSVRASTIATHNARASIVEGSSSPVKLADLRSIFKRDDDGLMEVTTEQVQRIRKTYLGFSEGAEFSFNYNTLLMVASILAGLGLAQGSSTTIIASMLVSPIMGPVMGIAYGGYIHDLKLKRKAFLTELASLGVCIVFGAMIGACTGWTDLATDWPNDEMYNRGTWQNLLVGLPVAFFSGLGVAVSMLDEQTSSLVGVAISASLLPPAVNAGLLLVACPFYMHNVQNGEIVRVPGGGGYFDVWDATEDELKWARNHFLKSAFISFLLTVVNILLIIVASSLMFRLKERLPIRKKIYWLDLAATRAINKNMAMQFDDDELNETELNNAIQRAGPGDTNEVYISNETGIDTPPEGSKRSAQTMEVLDEIYGEEDEEIQEDSGKYVNEWMKSD